MTQTTLVVDPVVDVEVRADRLRFAEEREERVLPLALADDFHQLALPAVARIVVQVLTQRVCVNNRELPQASQGRVVDVGGHGCIIPSSWFGWWRSQTSSAGNADILVRGLSDAETPSRSVRPACSRSTPSCRTRRPGT